MKTSTRNTSAMATMNNITKNIITVRTGTRNTTIKSTTITTMRTTTSTIIKQTAIRSSSTTTRNKTKPESHKFDPNQCDEAARHPDERQTHHRSGSSQSTIDHEINPHHLTDYRYRLPPAIDSPDVASVSSFTAIIPEPIGLPDMYYPNAWDLPDDPRRAHPTLPLTPLIIEEVGKENSPVPSGKGRPVFPWEANGSSSIKSPRTPTRTYYNFTANAEERRRQKEAETARRLEYEEAALEKIRHQEHARYESDRLKEEAHEKVTGSQAFENFRLVNAWDVDLGVQMSMLQKTEKRRPRSRKSSAGAIRKGYGLEDMLAYEAKQRQEQYEAELIQKRLEEEERWAKEQEEARIKEEEARLEKLRIAKLAKTQAQKRFTQQEEGSLYVFRNAWDSPNMALNKKKLRIEDDEIELALPLRQDRRFRNMAFSSGAGASGETDKAEVHEARHVESKAHGRIVTTEESESREAQEAESSSKATRVVGAGAAASGSLALVNLERSGDIQSGESSSSTTTKITTPGSHRFVRTTVTTTIIRRKFKNGVEVSSESSTSSTGGETMFEIPAGERTLPYFTGGRRTVSVTNTQEASRLGSGSTTTTTTTGATRSITSQTTENSRSSEVAQGAKSTKTHAIGKMSCNAHLVGSSTDTTITTKTAAKKSGGQVTTTESRTSESTQSGTTFSTQGGKKFSGLALQIDTTPVQDQEIDEAEDLLERQRRSDIREKEASAQAAAEAMQVLSKYPQATSRYARHTTSSTSSSGRSKMATTGLYAADPNLPRQAQAVSEGQGLKVKAVYTEGSGDEEYLHMLDQEEDYDELEYFGEKHTHAALPLGSPYMPSTPIAPSHRYGASASGFSSRAGSRPTTPGPSTPSRFGSSTPKGFVSKRGVELKQSAIGSSTLAEKETQQDAGFSNYRIEWNWKELLGKKPRHWTAEKGQEHYDPYNALSTHGSLIDSDEDDGRLLESSDEDSEEEEQILLQRSRSTSGGSAGSSMPQTPSFASGEDNEFTRESGFVIRGGKIARRRSSMALDRQEL
ncbi:hypothetical protein BG003_005702 [Podila horticola]|nr:hypothetical protein BG003_005702 [Podila horticola]